ncbi:hypothetical protein LXL04_028369 [Taraxacum kok-saghyz]
MLKYLKKQPSKALQEDWNQIFCDAVTSGIDCVAPSVDPSNDVPHFIIDDENPRTVCAPLENRENGDDVYFSNLMGFATDVFSPNNVGGFNTEKSSKKCLKLKPTQMKGNKRESSGAKMFKNFMFEQNSTHKRTIELLEIDASPVNQSDEFSVIAVINLINNMVEDGIMTKGSELWCFAMTLFDDTVKRELFISLPDDAGRLAWLNYKRDWKRLNGYQKKKEKKKPFMHKFVIVAYFCKYIYKEPCMTLDQTGEMWMNDVLNGSPIRNANAFRMHPNVFVKLGRELELKYGLKSSNKMLSVEKLGIFVYILAVGLSNRDVGERFQRYGDTISRAFHEVLEAITARGKCFQGLACDIIRPKDPTFQSIPLQMKEDKRYMPYFKDCIGCIDGTHILACKPENEQLRYIGRKGVSTFNVMVTCDFDMCFTFACVGWEGSAHDTRVFLHAINTTSMNFPKPLEGYSDRNKYMFHISRYDTINLNFKMSL